VTLRIVQDETADELLSTNPFALLCGMLLQQQVPIEVAFSGPAKIRERLGSFDPVAVEACAAEDFAKLCATDPAVHPYPESMSVLIQAVARFVVANYAGDTASLWETAGSGEHLLSRLMLLPGFSKRQAQMMIALLGKQLDVRPPGWEEAAGQFAKPDVYRSVADVRDSESLEKVQSSKSKRSKRQGDADGDGDEKPKTSRTTKSSKGSGKVTMQEDQADKAGDSEERATRKAARKAAKRAAKRTAKAGESDSAGTDKRAGAKKAAKRAGAKAKKAAKRAARREARVADPDAPVKKGGGRTAEGRRGNRERGGARRGREQTESATAADESSDGLTSDGVSDDALNATEGASTGESAPEPTTESAPADGSAEGEDSPHTSGQG
jgi:uncharacterized HhH-GPD family protein